MVNCIKCSRQVQKNKYYRLTLINCYHNIITHTAYNVNEILLEFVFRSVCFCLEPYLDVYKNASNTTKHKQFLFKIYPYYFQCFCSKCIHSIFSMCIQPVCSYYTMEIKPFLSLWKVHAVFYTTKIHRVDSLDPTFLFSVKRYYLNKIIKVDIKKKQSSILLSKW